MRPSPQESRNISLVGHHDLNGRPGFKIDLQRHGTEWYLYLGHFWHSGWTVLNVTNPGSPEHVRFVDGPANTLTHDVQVADDTLVTSLEPPRMNWGTVDGDRMDPDGPYTEGIYVFDVSDPTEPRHRGHYATDGRGTHRNFYPGGDRVFLSAEPDGFDGRIFVTVDISDPTAPTEVASWWWPGQRRDDSETMEVSKFHHGFPYVRDERGYLPYGRLGMVVLNLADSTEPEYLTRLDLGGLGTWVGTHSTIPLPESDLAIVTNEPGSEAESISSEDPWSYAFVVDVSDPSPQSFDGKRAQGPQVVNALPTPTPQSHRSFESYHEQAGRFGPHNVHYSRPGDDSRLRSNDLLFATYFNAGLRVFDLSNPRRPCEVGHFVPDDPPRRIGTRRPMSDLVSHFEDIAVDSRGFIYCTDPNWGLFVFDSAFA